MTLDQIKSLVGDLARPFALIFGALTSGVATVILACRIGGDLGLAALFVAAANGGVAALYGAKAWENRGIAKHNAPSA